MANIDTKTCFSASLLMAELLFICIASVAAQELIYRPSQETTVWEGQAQDIECEVTGRNRTPGQYWRVMPSGANYTLEEIIKHNSNGTFTNNQILRVKAFTSQDAGKYICTFHNHEATVVLGFQPACEAGKFGIGCTSTCSRFCRLSDKEDDSPCHYLNGTCLFGCQDGYMGSNCSFVCPDGTYGVECSQVCSEFCKDSCNPINGTCVNGCQSGYEGAHCLTSTPASGSTALILSAIAITLIVILMLILIYMNRQQICSYCQRICRYCQRIYRTSTSNGQADQEDELQMALLNPTSGLAAPTTSVSTTAAATTAQTTTTAAAIHSPASSVNPLRPDTTRDVPVTREHLVSGGDTTAPTASCTFSSDDVEPRNTNSSQRPSSTYRTSVGIDQGPTVQGPPLPESADIPATLPSFTAETSTIEYSSGAVGESDLAAPRNTLQPDSSLPDLISASDQDISDAIKSSDTGSQDISIDATLDRPTAPPTHRGTMPTSDSARSELPRGITDDTPPSSIITPSVSDTAAINPSGSSSSSAAPKPPSSATPKEQKTGSSKDGSAKGDKKDKGKGKKRTHRKMPKKVVIERGRNVAIGGNIYDMSNRPQKHRGKESDDDIGKKRDTRSAFTDRSSSDTS